VLLHSYAAAGRLMALKFISTMSASADVLALASVEVDISNIAEGQVRAVWLQHNCYDRWHSHLNQLSSVHPTTLLHTLLRLSVARAIDCAWWHGSSL
jgi:hypothetical protein